MTTSRDDLTPTHRLVQPLAGEEMARYEREHEAPATSPQPDGMGAIFGQARGGGKTEALDAEAKAAEEKGARVYQATGERAELESRMRRIAIEVIETALQGHVAFHHDQAQRLDTLKLQAAARDLDDIRTVLAGMEVRGAPTNAPLAYRVRTLVELQRSTQSELDEARRAAAAWEESAAMSSRNADYYRGLLDQLDRFAIEEGDRRLVRTQDDGGVLSMDDQPLYSKLVELIRGKILRLVRERDEAWSELRTLVELQRSTQSKLCETRRALAELRGYEDSTTNPKTPPGVRYGFAGAALQSVALEGEAASWDEVDAEVKRTDRVGARKSRGDTQTTPEGAFVVLRPFQAALLGAVGAVVAMVFAVLLARVP